ncbi:hypothetical protein [Georgenia ruanii]|uniref:hypothetical protein n=1 Tax=Georgenia ruanii TaxID=348442 RepID=UPI0012649125|nr:hypothetical protein [Georgenia ruanii]
MSRSSRTVLAVATLAAVAGAGAVTLEQAGWWDTGAATTSHSSAPAPTTPTTVELRGSVETLLAQAAALKRSGPAGTTAGPGAAGGRTGRAASGGDGDDGGRAASAVGTPDARDADTRGDDDDHESWQHDRRERDEHDSHHDGHRHHHDRDEDESDDS